MNQFRDYHSTDLCMPCGCPYPPIGDHTPCVHGNNEQMINYSVPDSPDPTEKVIEIEPIYEGRLTDMAELVNTPFLSRKVIASTVTGALMFVASAVTTKLGFHLTDEVALSVTGLLTAAGTFVGGFVKRELPNVTAE